MPRYRVVLEFDHPGDGHLCENGDTTRGPQHWRWDKHVSDDASNVQCVAVEVRRVAWVPLPMDAQ